MIKLQGFPTQSFPVCTVPKTENLELKTSEYSLRFIRTTILLIELCNYNTLQVIWYFDQSHFVQYKLALTHFEQTPSFSNSELSFLHYTQNWKLGEGKPRSVIKQTWRRLGGYHLRVFGFECGAKWKTWSWKTSEFDQNTSEFHQNAPENNSKFLVLGVVENEKLEVEKPRKYILLGFRVFRELQVVDLTVTNLVVYDFGRSI